MLCTRYIYLYSNTGIFSTWGSIQNFAWIFSRYRHEIFYKHMCALLPYLYYLPIRTYIYISIHTKFTHTIPIRTNNELLSYTGSYLTAKHNIRYPMFSNLQTRSVLVFASKTVICVILSIFSLFILLRSHWTEIVLKTTNVLIELLMNIDP